MRAVAAVLAALVLALSMPSAAADDPESRVEGCAVSPGGWGAEPHGANAGALLHSRFVDVFGDQLIVGPHVLESAQEVTDLLPAETDPLLSHAISLAINLAFGSHYLDGTLRGVQVPAGEYAGWTAEDLLTLAEAALFDPLRSTSKYSTLIEATTSMNEQEFGCTLSTPPAPQNVECAFDEGVIVATWDAVSGVQSYNVYRATGGGAFVLIGNTADEEYEDAAVVPGETYTYRATSIRGGMQSAPSEECTTTAIPFFPGALGAAAAGAAALLGYVALRRR